jgi:ParB/RepB/Spo0J family partition protein
MQIPLDDLTFGDDVRLDEDPDALGQLAFSIAELGILQPLLVRPMADMWEVVAGRRRLAAARLAGLETVPCIVRDIDDDRAFDLALAENLHRRDLSWIEVALAYDRLRARGLQQRQIATLVGRHESQVSQVLKLLTIPREIQDRVHRREISYSTALDLATRGKTKNTTGGKGTHAQLTGEDAQIATHWRRRHDRLVAGLLQIIRSQEMTGLGLRTMLERLLKVDRQPLPSDHGVEPCP